MAARSAWLMISDWSTSSISCGCSSGRGPPLFARPVIRIAVAVAIAMLYRRRRHRPTTAVTRALVRAIAALISQVAPHRCASRKDLRSGLRTEPDLLSFHRAVLEQDQRGDVADAVLRRRLRIRLDVDLGDAQLVFVFGRDLVEDRRDHLAGATPLGPEIEKNGLVGLEHVLAERCVRGVHDVRVTHVEGPPWKTEYGFWASSDGFGWGFEAGASQRQKPCSGRDQTVRLPASQPDWPDGPLDG